MEMIWLLIILALFIIAVIYFSVKRLLKRPPTPDSLYAQALSLLLEGKRSEAIKKLRQTVAADTDNVEAYLRLGDLYREEGDLDMAVTVHRSLSVRRGLPREKELRIYESLGKDYIKAERYQRASLVYEELTKMDKKNLSFYETLLWLYQKTERWEELDETLKRLRKIQKNKNLLALYYAESAKSIYGKDKKQAMDYLKKALKLNPSCTQALLLLSHHYYQEKDIPKAIETYKKIIDKTPQYSFLVLNKLEKAYFDLGKFTDVIPLYEKFLKKIPSEPMLYLTLADIYEKKGEIDKALNLLENAKSERTPAIRFKTLSLKLKKGETKEVEKELAKYSEELLKPEFRCSKCGYLSSEFLFHCPSCQAWETFVRE